jgi:ribonucleotide reductase alpha subunit
MITIPSVLSWATARAASLDMTLDDYVASLIIDDQTRVGHMRDAAREVENRDKRMKRQREYSRDYKRNNLETLRLKDRDRKRARRGTVVSEDHRTDDKRDAQAERAE